MNAAGETLYASPAELEAWFARARPGERRTYALGPVLDRGNAAVQLVRRWQAAGQVTFTEQLGANRVRYRLIERTRPEPAPPGASTRRSRRQLDEAEALIAAIEDAARGKRPCPSNAELGLAIGASRDRAKYLLRQLVAAGRLAVWSLHSGGETVRVVGITATGQTTALPAAQRAGQAALLQAMIAPAFGGGGK